jgi:hypothetical protein
MEMKMMLILRNGNALWRNMHANCGSFGDIMVVTLSLFPAAQSGRNDDQSYNQTVLLETLTIVSFACRNRHNYRLAQGRTK